jgi:GTPase SAR1 family protein
MFTAKVMLLGDMGVGKTSIMYRLVYDRFEGNYKCNPPLRTALSNLDGL